jgi:putative glycosyltransferase (TIGR04372 family)
MKIRKGNESTRKQFLFVQLNSATFGHFVVESELYARKAQISSNLKVIFYPQRAISNLYWWKLLKRELFVVPEVLGRALNWIASRTSESYLKLKNEFLKIELEDYIKYEVHQSESKLRFSDIEYRKFQEFFTDFRFHKGKPTICLSLRDHRFDQTFGEEVVTAQKHRNMPSVWYRDIVERLVSRKMQVIRVGNHGFSLFEKSPELFVDYTQMQNEGNPALGFLFSANCDFFISTGTGIDAMAFAARKKIYSMNFFPMGTIYPTPLAPLYLVQDYIFIESEKKVLSDFIVENQLENLTLPELAKFGICIKPKNLEIVLAFIDLILNLEFCNHQTVCEHGNCTEKSILLEAFCKRWGLELFDKVIY